MNVALTTYFFQSLFLDTRFWLVLLLCMALAVLVAIRKKHEDWNKGWLSESIKKRITEPQSSSTKNDEPSFSLYNTFNLLRLGTLEVYDFIKSSFWQKILKEIKDFHLPSFTTIVSISVLFVGFFYLSHNDVPYQSIFTLSKWVTFFGSETQEAATTNIISIITGLTSIVFALVIFVAESIRDSKNPDHKRVLLKISNLWPLITITVLSLLNFLIFKINTFSIFAPIIIGCLSIYSFWKIIIHLVDPVTQEEDNNSFLRKRIQDNVNESINERIGNTILFEQIGYDKEIKFEYTFSKSWLTGHAEDYIFISSESEGRIVDVNLGELQKLANYLKVEAEKMGFSIYPSTKDIAGQINHAENSKKEDVNIKKIYLFKRFGQYIPPTSIFADDAQIVFAIPKEFVSNEAVPKYVKGVIPHIFRFSKDRPSSEIFRKEMKGIKDRMINAIRSTSIGVIEELSQSYLDLAEIFLESIHKFGGGYSAEQAKKERGNFFEGWNEIRWLREDIRELIQIASDNNNQDIIADIIYLPTAIASRAFRIKDHFLFQEFLSFYSFVYFLASDKKEERIRSFMIDRSWRHLKELSDFYIEPKIRDKDSSVVKDDIPEYREFALFIFKIFQTLIKASFDKRDYESFEIFLSGFTSLYNRIDREYPDSEYLKWALEQETDADKQNEIRTNLEKQSVKEETIAKLQLSKKQVIFALASKILDHYKKNKLDPVVKQFFDNINAQNNFTIEDLTRLFDASRNFKSEDYWGWDDWEMISDGEVHAIDVHSKFDYFFCIKLLTLLRSRSDEEIAALDMPHSRNLAFLAEDRNDNSTLISKLREIKADPQGWLFVLDQQAIGKVDKCIELLQSVKEKQKLSEAEFLKTAQISQEKLNEFKEEIKNSFTESARVRDLVKTYGIYVDKTTEKPGLAVPSYGYNQIDDKAAFVKDWYVHYGGWGERFGTGLANSEDQIFFETIVSNLSEQIEIKSSLLIEKIKKIVDDKKFSEPVVIQSLEYLLEYDSLKGSERFVDKWRKDCPATKISHLEGFMGVLRFGTKIIPVFDIFVRDKKLNNKVAVVDLSKLGIWEQYSPLDKEEDVQYLYDIFYLRVTDLNNDDEVRNKIVSEDSTWLQEHVDKEGYLRQKVNIRLYEKFKFVVTDKKSGVLISVTK